MTKKSRLEKIKQLTKEAELQSLVTKASEIANAETDENATNETSSYADRFTNALIDSIVIEGLDD